ILNQVDEEGGSAGMAVARLQPAVVAVALETVRPGAERGEASGPDVAERAVADVALALGLVGGCAGHDLAGRRDNAGDPPRPAQKRIVAIEAIVVACAAPLIVQLDVEQ